MNQAREATGTNRRLRELVVEVSVVDTPRFCVGTSDPEGHRRTMLEIYRRVNGTCRCGVRRRDTDPSCPNCDM